MCVIRMLQLDASCKEIFDTFRVTGVFVQRVDKAIHFMQKTGDTMPIAVIYEFICNNNSIAQKNVHQLCLPPKSKCG